MSSSEAHSANVVRGLKASINNPRVSDEAKDNAQRRIEEIESGGDADYTQGAGSRTRRGAAQDTSDEEDTQPGRGRHTAHGGSHDADFDDPSKNRGNVIGGYKATLKNPRVGEEAKVHAREVLEENDALPKE